MKTIEIKASTVEDAIEKGLIELNKKREEVDIEILDIGGFLKKAKVILTVKPTDSEKACEFLSSLLKKMNLNVSVNLKDEQEEKTVFMLSGEDSGKVIGYRGDVLDAVQYITSVVINRGQENYKKIIIDCENYRSKREDILISLALKLAQKAVEKGRKMSLEPMNPFERRIIHAALQENKDVTTESEGIDPNRFIVIKPKNFTPYNKYDTQKRERPNTWDKPAYNDRNKSSAKDNDNSGRERPSDRQRTSSSTKSPSKGFGGFGTYLGNSKSGFASDNSFIKKSGFDNLKD